MEQELILKRLKNLYDEATSVKSSYEENRFPGTLNLYSNKVNKQMYTRWRSKCIIFMEHILKNDDYRLLVFKKDLQENIKDNVDAGAGILESLIDDINDGSFILKDELTQNEDINEIIENIFIKFHRISLQLTRRHDNRKTIIIEDEYDVQDLLHSLLLLYFDNVKDEEYTPSHGSKSTRIDFLIKDIKLAIETKFVSERLKDKKLSNELILDKERYFSHPDCKTLYFFVYDPDGFINNPYSIENEISEKNENHEVKVKIWPKS